MPRFFFQGLSQTELNAHLTYSRKLMNNSPKNCVFLEAKGAGSSSFRERLRISQFGSNIRCDVIYENVDECFDCAFHKNELFLNVFNLIQKWKVRKWNISSDLKTEERPRLFVYRKFLLETRKDGRWTTSLKKVDCHELERVGRDRFPWGIADLLPLRPVLHRHHQRTNAPIRCRYIEDKM